MSLKTMAVAGTVLATLTIGVAGPAFAATQSIPSDWSDSVGERAIKRILNTNACSGFSESCHDNIVNNIDNS